MNIENRDITTVYLQARRGNLKIGEDTLQNSNATFISSLSPVISTEILREMQTNFPNLRNVVIPIEAAIRLPIGEARAFPFSLTLVDQGLEHS